MMTLYLKIISEINSITLIMIKVYDMKYLSVIVTSSASWSDQYGL